MSFSINSDLALQLEQTNTLSFKKKTAEGVYTTFTIANVAKWPAEESLYVEMGESPLTTQLTSFYSWADFMQSQIPNQGDVWVDDGGVSWTIMKVDAAVQGGEYEMVCRRQV